jgi:hypothetical protein
MPNRNPAPVSLERRFRVARLYFRGGVTQRQLAERFQCSQAQICHDLHAVQRHWRKMMGADRLDDLKADLIAELDMVKAEAKRGWRRSLRNAERKKAKIVNADGEARKETEKTSEGRAGHQPFLETIRNCNADLRKMLGLDAPQKIAPTTPDGDALPLVRVIEVVRPSENGAAHGDAERPV